LPVKKIIILLACAALVLSLSGVAVSAQTSHAPQKDRMKGTVMTVDTVASVLTIKSKQATISFEVNDSTKLLLNGKQVKMSAIPVSSVATILYMRHGNMRLALWIMAETRQYSQMGKQQVRPILAD
jgi:hypothetical protein